ncbi:MAG TPA: 3-methyladenine DNA glycosylase [Balneolaceae bacterium]|nr:3-methyladenine DNA glycosylase [Balneolaceae bacterium]|tara:strand:+ start:173118 stop:174020 length:903 start_codon:yes stop_codon:yes gene_type:complete
MIEQEIDIPNHISEVLTTEVWLQKKRLHEEKVAALTDDYLKARSHHQKQPTMDFLFEYYKFRVSALKRWSPGLFTALELNPGHTLPEVSEITTADRLAFLNPDLFPKKRLRSVQWILSVLKNSADKKPSFGCFGMHEWAMVYKTDDVRHAQLGLRMNPKELADFVESRPVVCTHFDAFRFFTPQAVPLNKFQLSRETFHETEQPGCIHSNMDLYKWAYKLYPWISSEIILDAFELAIEARTIDMKASPYDLRDEGLEPIFIETEEGRRIYLREQESIYKKGIPVREKLIREYEQLLNIFS